MARSMSLAAVYCDACEPAESSPVSSATSTRRISARDMSSRPVANVSAIPAAHLFTVLNVAGATTTASASGSSSGSSGSLNPVRTRSPVSAASSSTSMNRSPIGVATTRTSHPELCARVRSSPTFAAAGAPHTTTYSTPRDRLCALINRERSPCFGVRPLPLWREDFLHDRHGRRATHARPFRACDPYYAPLPRPLPGGR
jgi:hypothetical protein